MSLRLLQPGDEHRLRRFLRQHADSSLSLRSHLLAGGLEDPEARGLWAAWTQGDQVRSVVCHAPNGNLLLQAPEAIVALVDFAARTSGRPVRGLIGPWSQVGLARRALGADASVPQVESYEGLYALDLLRLRIPDPLLSKAVVCRGPQSSELELLAQWRHEYRVRTVGDLPAPTLLDECRREAAKARAENTWVVLAHEGQVVSLAAIHGAVEECVQVGGVFTPPELRSRGYARAVVAGTLLYARSRGALRGVLFTGDENTAAQAAYLALGFEKVGDYGLMLWDEAQLLRG